MAKLISGQTVVTTAGTAVVLGSASVDGSVVIKALAGNTGKVYIGNDGANDVTSANGFELSAGDLIVLDNVKSLAGMYLDSAVSGEGVSWIFLASSILG